jgi:hypothetical protein
VHSISGSSIGQGYVMEIVRCKVEFPAKHLADTVIKDMTEKRKFIPSHHE